MRRPIGKLVIVDSSDLRVELRFATLPSVLRAIAVHHWFVVLDAGAEQADRWEVWQSRNAGGQSWGHVHRNLMHPDRPVGGGPTCVAARWHGDQAQRLRAVLVQPQVYPFQERYRYWPGPNSNTYAAWVLLKADVAHRFDLRAFGQGYPTRRS